MTDTTPTQPSGPPSTPPANAISAMESLSGFLKGSSTTTTVLSTGVGTAADADPTKEPNAAGNTATGAAGLVAATGTQNPSGVAATSTTNSEGSEVTINADAGASNDGQDTQQASVQSSRGMSEGTKIGIGVGVGIGAAIVFALIALLFIMRRRRKNRYSSHPSAENMRGQPAMTSTEPALGAVSALGRSPSYRSNNRSSYHSLSPTSPPPLPETAPDPMAEATKGTIPAQPTIIPPSQQSLPHSPEVDTPRGRRSLEAEVVASPINESLATPAPPYDEAPSPVDQPPSRPISPVSPVSSMGSRPHSLRRSFESR